MDKTIDWRLFVILWAASILAGLALIPYLLAMGFLDAARLPLPPVVAVAMIPLQGAVLSAIVIFVGLYLGKRTGLGAPFLARGRPSTAAALGPTLMLSAGLGALAGAVIFVLDRYVFALAIEPVTAFQADSPLWTRLLLSFSAGVNEEVMMRLGLMTLIVWVTWRIRATPDGKPTGIGVWIAILIVSVVFGLGHLPMTARLMQISPLVVLRAIVLNGIASVIFGWLYWRRGLEAAMVSHFSADVGLHVLLPLVA